MAFTRNKKKKFIDLSGKTFGKWKVLSLSKPPEKYKHNKWICECECGKVLAVADSSLVVGKSKSCGCLRDESTGLRFTKFPNKQIAAEYNCYNRYARQAFRRQKPFELTRNEFLHIIKLKCHYCGIEPNKEYPNINYKVLGIDRIDNNLGYIISNCVPCCKECNFAKVKLSSEQFLNLIVRIYKHNFG